MLSTGFLVSKDKEDALQAKMDALGVRGSDLEEKFIRAGGRGGQKINKTSICVYLKYIPLGIEVKCDSARSQAMNRFLARRLLLQKIENLILGKESAAEKAREKIRRKKRRRSRRAKENMLENKRKRAAKKELRRSPSWE